MILSFNSTKDGNNFMFSFVKKIFLVIFLFLISPAAFADDDTAAVRKFFDSYVNAANTYKSSYFDYYTPNARIIRVVVKKDGSTQSVVVPMATYMKETNKGTKIGKIARYKNNYSNINIEPQGEDYKLTATRTPSTGGGSFPAYFIIGKDASGNWKIKEESMNTKVQKFLKG